MPKQNHNFEIQSKWNKLEIENRLYQIPVPIVGLTGGIATGKTTVSHLFRENNVPVIDADQLVKKVYQKPEVIQFVHNHFNSAIENGNINFKILRQLAFSNAENIAKIEKCIYQHMPSEFKKAFSEFHSPNFIIYDVPLLFEKGLDQFVDVKICVYTPLENQIKRLMDRDQIDRDSAKKIIQHQMDIEIKKDKSDLVIINNDGLDDLKNNFKNILKQLVK